MKHLLSATLFLHSLTLIAQNNCHDHWPTNEWKQSLPSHVGINEVALKELEQYVFSGKTSNSLLVIKNGCLVLERHSNGFTGEEPQRMWSISKTFTGALAGIAYSSGKLMVNSPAKNYYPLMSKNGHENITGWDLLHMRSGMQWNESYNDVVNSDVINMLYGAGSSNMASYVANLPQLHKPGSEFLYSSGTTNVVSKIIHSTYSQKAYDSLPWKKLFNPLGFKSATFEQDSSQVFVGSSSLFLRPQDLAKFGYLYLRNGTWENNEVISPTWILKSKGLDSFEERYSAFWWLNRDKSYATIPSDTMMAMGFGGQYLVVIPSLDLILVKTGWDMKGEVRFSQMLKKMMASLDNKPILNSSLSDSKLDEIQDENLLGSLDSNAATTVTKTFAKEYCSCIFISKQNHDYCLDYINQTLPAPEVNVRIENNSAVAEGFGIKQTAKFISEKLGCRL